MLIHFVDRNQKVVDALNKQFFDLVIGGTVRVTLGDLSDYVEKYPVLISAGNSFGVIDGGSDKVYLDKFGACLQDDLRNVIATDFFGEVPVGCTAVVAIDETQTLICAPTMRVPQFIRDTSNAYLAFRAALLTYLKNEFTGNILCPGFGTGVGKMDPEIAAHQLRQAYNKALHDFHEAKMPLELGAATRHELLLHVC